MDSNTPVQSVYNPQLVTPQVYTPPYQPIPQQPSKKRKIFKYLGIFLLIVGFLFVLNVIKAKQEYHKPKAWVIFQSLNSSLAKKQVLAKSIKDGQLTVADLVKVATASTLVKAEVVKVGKDYLLSTGSDGQAQVDLPQGIYKVSLVAIPGVDFTGVPSKLNLSGEIYEFKIGLKEGSRKIKGKAADLSSKKYQGQTKLVVTLFQDKNGNGIKGKDEPSLPWAGVTIKLRSL